MTLVVARRFGRGVVIMADTMLTDDRGVSRGLRPGQLKILPVADRVTIAHSGVVVQALDLIRSARRELRTGASLHDVIRDLTRATRHDDCEFVVCAHTPDVLLVKLRHGRLARGSDRFALGDATPLKRLSPISKYDPESSQPEHVRFQLQMLELFHEEGHKLSSTVGGFLIIRSCTPDAHQYIDHHATLTWETIMLPPGITAAQEHDRASGATMLTYNCLTPRGFDGAVVGFYLPQPRLGFVFAPIVQDDAVIIRDADSELVAAEVDRHLRL